MDDFRTLRSASGPPQVREADLMWTCVSEVARFVKPNGDRDLKSPETSGLGAVTIASKPPTPGLGAVTIAPKPPTLGLGVVTIASKPPTPGLGLFGRRREHVDRLGVGEVAVLTQRWVGGSGGRFQTPNQCPP